MHPATNTNITTSQANNINHNTNSTNHRQQRTRSVHFDLPDDDEITNTVGNRSRTTMATYDHNNYNSNRRRPPPAYREATAPSPPPPPYNMRYQQRPAEPLNSANLAAIAVSPAAIRQPSDFMRVQYHTTTQAVGSIDQTSTDRYKYVVHGKTVINKNSGNCTEYRTDETFYVEDDNSGVVSPICCSTGAALGFSWCTTRRALNIVLVSAMLGLVGLWIWYIQVIHQHNNLMYTTKAAITSNKEVSRLTAEATVSQLLLTNALAGKFNNTTTQQQFAPLSTASTTKTMHHNTDKSSSAAEFTNAATTHHRFIPPQMANRAAAIRSMYVQQDDI